MTAPSRPTTLRATINDVARAANVSRQTVSNVVNRPERVAPATRERVEAEIARLGYRPSSAAKSLRQQRAGAIGIELNTLGAEARNEVVYPFVVELSIQARAHSCHVVTFGSEARTPSITGYESMIRARLVDAFVLADTHHGDTRPAYLDEANIPFAAFGRIWDDPAQTRWADVDGRSGTRLATEHLIEQGYERIGYLAWPTGSATGDDRRAGWRDALEAAGLLDESLVVETVQDLGEARQAAAGLVERIGPGGAIVGVSDVVALGALQAAHLAGRRIGEDFAVTGFDGSSLAAMNDMTTLSQPLDLVADHLLTMIAGALAGEPAPEQGVLVTPTLHVRASSRRAASTA